MVEFVSILLELFVKGSRVAQVSIVFLELTSVIVVRVYELLLSQLLSFKFDHRMLRIKINFYINIVRSFNQLLTFKHGLRLVTTMMMVSINFSILLVAVSMVAVAISDHHTKARFRALHLRILLKQASVLNLRVTVTELVLLFRFLVPVTSIATITMVIIGILFIFNHRLNFVILKLAIPRIVLGVAERQNVTALI